MINRVCLQGRLTKDVEIKNTQSGNAVGTFTIASDRAFKNEQGKYDADFISCVAWGKTATFISSYFHKGDQIVVSGRLQTRSYEDRDGRKVFVTEVVVDEASFCGGTSKPQTNSKPSQPVYEEEDEEIPFDI